MKTVPFSPGRRRCDRCPPKNHRPVWTAIATSKAVLWLCPMHAAEFVVAESGWGSFR